MPFPLSTKNIFNCMTGQYFAPAIGKTSYHCPQCNVYSQQRYAHLTTRNNVSQPTVITNLDQFGQHISYDWIVTRCDHCSKLSFWHEEQLVFPEKTIAPPPNNDLSESIKTDYLEAAAVYGKSPRAAAALLRLALQKLCKDLGQDGKNINDDIKNLVASGLNPLVQKALDSLRITGNNAVHPGEINLSEMPGRVVKLFELINFIADKMITEPKEITSFYEGLPEGALDAIERRDA